VAVGLGEGPGRAGLRHRAARRAAGAAGAQPGRAPARSPYAVRRRRRPTPRSSSGRGEGALLGAYAFDRYRTRRPTSAASRCARSCSPCLEQGPGEGQGPAGRRAPRGGHRPAVALARDLVNTPPSDLHPAELADVARARRSAPASTWRSSRARSSSRAASAASSASARLGQRPAPGPPVLPRRQGHRHQGRPRRQGHHLRLRRPVAQPAASMEEMKGDMGGAAAVLATMAAVAELALPVDVEAWSPWPRTCPAARRSARRTC
jgi:leucyl aminopeptidase